MNYDQQVQVFEDSQLIRDTVKSLCKDRLLFIAAADPREEWDRRDAIHQLCGEILSLQGRTFQFRNLKDKCAAAIQRSRYEPLKRLRAEDLANEICSPMGGW